MSYSNCVKKFTGVLLSQTAVLVGRCDGVRRYDTTCYFNVRSKADLSALNLPHGNVDLLSFVQFVWRRPSPSHQQHRVRSLAAHGHHWAPHKFHQRRRAAAEVTTTVSRTGWAKKVTSQTHGHDFVKSKPILKLFFTERFCSKFAVAC